MQCAQDAPVGKAVCIAQLLTCMAVAGFWQSQLQQYGRYSTRKSSAWLVAQGGVSELKSEKD